MINSKSINQDRLSAKKSIEMLLKQHAAMPFGILREAGVQAELSNMLLTNFTNPASAQIQEHGGIKRFHWQNPINIKRIQLEMKIGKVISKARAAECCNDARTDIVVLSTDHPIMLTCYPNGPGDVVASVRKQDVNVAIEIKASPSKTMEQKKKYANDIKRLLKLNGTYGIASFFVMLDKSQNIYGTDIKLSHKQTIDENNWAPLKALIPDLRIAELLPRNINCFVEIGFLDKRKKPSFVYAWVASSKKSPTSKPSATAIT